MEIAMYAFRLVVWLALALSAPFAAGQVLSLEEALKAGAAQSPRLAAQRYSVTSAREQVGRAGELPDPKLRLGIENLPVSGADRFRYDRDFMTSRSIGFMQEFPNSEKREARNLRAERARDVEQGMLESHSAMLNRDIAAAWFEVHFAERARAFLEKQESQLVQQEEALRPEIARGRRTAAESLAVRAAAEQVRDRMLDQERVISRARIGLAALLGDEAKRPLGAAPDTAKLLHPRDALMADIHAHPHIRVYDRREDLARSEVEVARASRHSDWSLEVGYGQRRPYFDNMLTVMVAIDLPWQRERRQDQDVASKLAELEQARAQREEARRMHVAELRGWLADYDAATKRVERYQEVVLPLARQRVDAALAAYRGGRGELTPVLEAIRAVTDSELAALGVEAERARSWAQLSYLYPDHGSRP